jgi:hypothetical protein
MKLLINIFFSILLLSSCSSEEDKSKSYELTYVVFYPNYVDTVKMSGYGECYWFGREGTNYIRNTNSHYIYNGSAPYKILSYTVKENK